MQQCCAEIKVIRCRGKAGDQPGKANYRKHYYALSGPIHIAHLPPLILINGPCPTCTQAQATLSSAMGALSEAATPSSAAGNGRHDGSRGAKPPTQLGKPQDGKSRQVPPGDCKLRGVTRHR